MNGKITVDTALIAQMRVRAVTAIDHYRDTDVVLPISALELLALAEGAELALRNG